MKIKVIFLVSLIALATVHAHGQGTVIYDQQSSTESNVLEGGSYIQSNQPFGQSFTPSLNAVAFIRLDLFSDSVAGGALVDILLHANSISGPVIGTSETVSLPNNSGGFINFYFATPVSVIPGTTYYFQPVVQPGGNDVGAFSSSAYNYPGGVEISQGASFPNFDLWFREGIVVPEPSTWALLLIGVGAFLWYRRR